MLYVVAVQSIFKGPLCKKGMGTRGVRSWKILKNWRDRYFKLHVHLLAEVAELQYYKGQTRRGALLFNHNTFVKRVKDLDDHKCCFTVVTSFEKKTLFASARCVSPIVPNRPALQLRPCLLFAMTFVHKMVVLAHRLCLLRCAPCMTGMMLIERCGFPIFPK